MGKNQDPGSGINIPDPQHWTYDANPTQSAFTKLIFSFRSFTGIRSGISRLQFFYAGRTLLQRYDTVILSVADPEPYVLGLPDPDPLVRGADPAPEPDPSFIKQNSKKNIDSYCFVTSL